MFLLDQKLEVEKQPERDWGIIMGRACRIQVFWIDWSFSKGLFSLFGFWRVRYILYPYLFFPLIFCCGICIRRLSVKGDWWTTRGGFFSLFSFCNVYGHDIWGIRCGGLFVPSRYRRSQLQLSSKLIKKEPLVRMIPALICILCVYLLGYRGGITLIELGQ